MIGAFLNLLFFMKASFYLTLNDKISPLIDILYQIFFEIKYFLVVLIMANLAVSVSFVLLA